MNRCLALALCVVALTADGQAVGSQPVSGQPVGGQVALGQIAGGLGQSPSAAPQTGSPVSMVFERKSVQTLADGTHITRITHETFYRDSQGRTRAEFEFNTAPSMAQGARSNVIVTDPVASKSILWNIGPGFPKAYTVTPTRPPATPAGSAGLRTAPPVPGSSQAAMLTAPPPPSIVMRAASSTETLGPQEVQGAACTATRSTSIFPVDMIGNDRPITVVQERMSREFGRVLSETVDDPRTGLRTLTLTSLSRSEPDPTLFQPPAGFTERQRPAAPTLELPVNK
jgi:hypothetical protein